MLVPAGAKRKDRIQSLHCHSATVTETTAHIRISFDERRMERKKSCCRRVERCYRFSIVDFETAKLCESIPRKIGTELLNTVASPPPLYILKWYHPRPSTGEANLRNHHRCAAQRAEQRTRANGSLKALYHPLLSPATKYHPSKVNDWWTNLFFALAQSAWYILLRRPSGGLSYTSFCYSVVVGEVVLRFFFPERDFCLERIGSRWYPEQVNFLLFVVDKVFDFQTAGWAILSVVFVRSEVDLWFSCVRVIIWT